MNDVLFTPLRLSELEALIANSVHRALQATGRPESTHTIEKPCNIREAAVFTNLEEPTLYRLAQQGKIPAHKKGKKWYFYESELNRWIKSGNYNVAGSSFIQDAEEAFLIANKKKGGIK